MKKHTRLVPIALALALAAGTASAADIGNLSGQSCGNLTGTWHFVNNQTGGAAAGTLYATWSSGTTCEATPSAVNSKLQHFYCTAAGTLLSAWTTLPGKLVLSDFSCETKCDPDPKTGTCK